MTRNVVLGSVVFGPGPARWSPPSAATISVVPTRFRVAKRAARSRSRGRFRAARLGDIGRESGSATVTACFALAAVIVLTVLVVQVAGLVAARHQAQAAADLAALAAAGELRYGAEAGCAAAQGLGRRMRAGMIRCEVSGWDVLIQVEEKIPVGPFGERSVRAIARAGPAEERS